MARGMKLCLSIFVRENGKIKYLECMCRVLRVGLDKCWVFPKYYTLFL